MHHRRLCGALVLAGILGLTLASGAAAASGFGRPILDRTEPEGALSGLTDLGGSGKKVGLGFEQTSEASGPQAGAFYRQADREPFLGPGFTDGDHARVAVCPGGPLTALDGDDSGHRAVLLANLTTFQAVSETGADISLPDLACLDAGHAVLSVLVTADSETHAWLFLVNPTTLELSTGMDLGSARPSARPAVAATRDRIHVAWVTGRALLLRSFVVTHSPFNVSDRPGIALDRGRTLASPQLAAAGKQVVIAWERDYSVVARVSTDRGRTFSARQTLLAGAPATARVAAATNADALGRTLLVSATSVSEGISATGRILRSTDGGATWRTVKGSVRRGGYVFGALRGTARSPQVILAWDQQFALTDGRIRVALGR